MPLRTETYDLDEEVQRLEDKIAELDDVLEDIEDDNPVAQRFENERVGLETTLEGVRWARDEAFEADYAPQWDEDADTITLGGLTAGEFGSIEDDIADGSGQGAVRIYQVARGTVDAPYVDDGMDDDQQIGAVSQLPLAYTKWAQTRIDELTGVGGNGETSYSELYAEMQATASDRT
ncbi:hypothetical protein [Natrinema salsiterrestre]|uniref:Uncharacterized protein n=1 Tax=Natrinema salsiterrestre TaxID=2950540 RepID=A0A9Q4L1J4_9EURY|nr:hypothetical protein [Natrinema salsiterrestre]MDF9748360.1 hypothetical protein [Natrinema salsiterrestre]